MKSPHVSQENLIKYKKPLYDKFFLNVKSGQLDISSFQ